VLHLLANQPVGGGFLGVPGLQELLGEQAQLGGIGGGVDGAAEPRRTSGYRSGPCPCFEIRIASRSSAISKMLIKIACGSDMRLSWPEHLQASRTVELAGESDRGMALALMGMSLLILAEDLLESEQAASEVTRQA
jgi:hypothetical protein